jgi:hypothetical protein
MCDSGSSLEDLMGDLFLLSEGQMARLSPFFPLAHGVPQVDDRRVVSGIVYVIRNGLQWKDAPRPMVPQDALQPLHALEPAGGVRQDLRRTQFRWSPTGADHDRRNTPEGSPHGGEPA